MEVRQRVRGVGRAVEAHHLAVRVGAFLKAADGRAHLGNCCPRENSFPFMNHEIYFVSRNLFVLSYVSHNYKYHGSSAKALHAHNLWVPEYEQVCSMIEVSCMGSVN